MEIEQDIDKLYLVDDQRAYEKERETVKGKRFYIQKKMVHDEVEKAKKRQEDKISDFYKLILRAKDNKHTFPIENIALQVLNILQDMEIELEINDISVSAFGVKGPYVVAIRSKLGASSLQEEGIVLTDLQSNPPVKQFFEIAPYNANTNEVRASSTSEDIAMSIFYKLGNEYTGLRLDKNQLDEPKNRIMKEITQVFGEASDILQYTIIQPRTECGVIRNDLRVIIKYNKANEAKVEPEGEKLASLKHISLGFGKRPLVATLPAGWRAAYGVQACCFRQECDLQNGKCVAREQAWSTSSYSEAARSEQIERKRKRMDEQNNKRKEKMNGFKLLQAELLDADVCSYFRAGKCANTIRECKSGRHRALAYSKAKIVCASARPDSKWICKWTTETCPYANHIQINPT
mmetsp:Transcript_31204/g.77808  ORF Transcript_31204/g.77808 Transcript_31204/m.77808 type:complete len:405 (-) Transcript_31204:368-1582(-)